VLYHLFHIPQGIKHLLIKYMSTSCIRLLRALKGMPNWIACCVKRKCFKTSAPSRIPVILQTSMAPWSDGIYRGGSHALPLLWASGCHHCVMLFVSDLNHYVWSSFCIKWNDWTWHKNHIEFLCSTSFPPSLPSIVLNKPMNYLCLIYHTEASQESLQPVRGNSSSKM
jgi:hypothetical protein